MKLTVKNIRRKWIVELPYEIVYNYMKNNANSICKIINDINTNEEIKTIIFVGGYCSNEIMLNLIKKGLNKITTYLQPSNPSFSIMEGAVLFGKKPSTINIRKAKYTIGKGVGVPWDDKLHLGKGKKIYIDELDEWYCDNYFKKFIEIGQDLKYQEEISRTEHLRGTSSTSTFYKIKKKNPLFTHEEGVEKIGKCTITLDDEYEDIKDRKIESTMKFGGTYIDVTTIHKQSGKTVKTKLIFD